MGTDMTVSVSDSSGTGPIANVGAVATYAAAGMTPQDEVRDRHREGTAFPTPDPDVLT